MKGNVWSVGYNSCGKLGLGDYTRRTLPQQITSLPTNIAIAARFNHSLFLDVDGNFWSVGSNSCGQLGLGDRQNRTSLQQITSLPKIRLPRGKVPTSARNICL